MSISLLNPIQDSGFGTRALSRGENAAESTFSRSGPERCKT
jgi:hypothetical protein